MNRYVVQFVVALALFLAITLTLYAIGPDAIVEALGVKNTYLTIFFFAIIGGVSAISAAGFYATVFSFALGGANPFLLALASAPGVLIGDSVFWYLGVNGKKAIEAEYGKVFNRFSRWHAGKPRWLTPVGIYIYTGFTPFPGDVLMVALAFINYPFRKILIPTLLGNYTLALIVSLSATLIV